MPCLLIALFISAVHASEVFLVFLQGASLLIVLFISAIHASDVFVVFCKGHTCLVF